MVRSYIFVIFFILVSTIHLILWLMRHYNDGHMNKVKLSDYTVWLCCILTLWKKCLRLLNVAVLMVSKVSLLPRVLQSSLWSADILSLNCWFSFLIAHIESAVSHLPKSKALTSASLNNFQKILDGLLPLRKSIRIYLSSNLSPSFTTCNMLYRRLQLLAV